MRKQRATARTIAELARELDNLKISFHMFVIDAPFHSEEEFCASSNPQISGQTLEIVNSLLRNFHQPIKRLHILNSVADVLSMIDDEGPDLEEAILAATDRNCRFFWPK